MILVTFYAGNINYYFKRKSVGNKLQLQKWSVKNGDYIRKSDDHYLNMDEIRKKEKVKRIVLSIVLLILAFSVEFFILRQIAQI